MRSIPNNKSHLFSIFHVLIVVLSCSFLFSSLHLNVASATADDNVFIDDDDDKYDRYDRYDYDDQLTDGWVSTGRNRNTKELEEFFKPFYKHDDVDTLTAKFVFNKASSKTPPDKPQVHDKDATDEENEESNDLGDDDEVVRRPRNKEIERKFLRLDSPRVSPDRRKEKLRLLQKFDTLKREEREEEKKRSEKAKLYEFLREKQYNPDKCKYGNVTICILENGLYDAYMKERES